MALLYQLPLLCVVLFLLFTALWGRRVSRPVRFVVALRSLFDTTTLIVLRVCPTVPLGESAEVGCADKVLGAQHAIDVPIPL